MNANIKKYIPADGLAGLKENFKTDAISGFIVFLLALPLSLGIAKASDFPPIMGLITAIIGGIVVSFFMGSRLTIKGPAAGLIVIVAGAVAEFGQGNNELGWKLALGAMVVAGVIQILFGVLKLGKLADFFPLSAIHGMLAAIGIIIIAKQIPVLLNDNPTLAKGKGPLELLANIPNFIANLDPKARDDFYRLLEQNEDDRVLLFVTHRLDEIKDIVNRQVYMDLGKIISDEIVKKA